MSKFEIEQKLRIQIGNIQDSLQLNGIQSEGIAHRYNEMNNSISRHKFI